MEDQAMEEAPLRRNMAYRSWAPLLPSRYRPKTVVINRATSGLGTKDWAAFARYLRSDDTRLPSHPSLRVAVAQAQDYDTYVGEDEWTRPRTREEEEADAADRSARPPPVPPFTPVVDAVAKAIADLNQGGLPRDSDFGVVVCGERCAAGDATWASLTKTVRCASTMDTFHVLRASTRLMLDWEVQTTDNAAMAASEPQPEAEASPADDISFLLKAFVRFDPCFEFRVFFALTTPSQSSTTASPRLLGITQRCVDQVFPYLAAMENDGRATIADAIESRLLDSKLGPFWAAIAIFAGDAAAAASTGGCENKQNGVGHGAATAVAHLDVIYQESASLPLYILGVGFAGALPAPALPSIAQEEHQEEVEQPPEIDGGVFRLFRSLRGLATFDAASTAQMTPRLRVAEERSDLCFDGRHLAGGLPVELQRPELFANADPVFAEFLARFNEQARRDREQQQREAAAKEAATCAP